MQLVMTSMRTIRFAVWSESRLPVAGRYPPITIDSLHCTREHPDIKSILVARQLNTLKARIISASPVIAGCLLNVDSE
jgi:hypothetical protein